MCSVGIGVLKPQVSEERRLEHIDINKSISGFGSSYSVLIICTEEFRFRFW